MKFVKTIYVPICNGILGEIGSLDVDSTHTHEIVDIPIDTLVLDLTKERLEDVEFGVEETA